MTRIQIWMFTMSAFVLGALLAGIFLVRGGFTTFAQAEELPPLAAYQKPSELIINASARIQPSVVFIGTEEKVARHRDPFDDGFFRPFERLKQFTRKGLGSGVLVERKDDTYYILTNNHVVGRADKMTVTLQNEKTFEALRVGTDPRSDIALIKIEAKGEDLALATLGNSDHTRVGELVLAVGAPFGLEQTVTHGIISAKGRENSAVADFPEFLQTDAAINPGNSGGPLVNLAGEVIGINTWIASRSGGSQGLAFAVPINLARSVMEMLIQEGQVTRAYLGVHIADVTDDDVVQLKLPERRGAKITRVLPTSPASAGGIKVNDIIVAVNGKTVDNAHALRTLVAFRKIGSNVAIDLIRDGKEIRLEVGLADLTAIQQNAFSLLGFSAENLTPKLARKHHHMQDTGIIITGVKKDSPASKAGMTVGMLVKEINGTGIANVGELAKGLDRADLKKGVTLYVQSVRTNESAVITNSRPILLRIDR